jgi:hypothetical protein
MTPASRSTAITHHRNAPLTGTTGNHDVNAVNDTPPIVEAIEGGKTSVVRGDEHSRQWHAAQQEHPVAAVRPIRRTTDELAADIAPRLRATLRYSAGRFQRFTSAGAWEVDATDGGTIKDELRRISREVGAMATSGRREQSAASRERLRLESEACFTSVRDRLRRLLYVRTVRASAPRPIQTGESIAPTLAKFGIDEETVTRVAREIQATHGDRWNQHELRFFLQVDTSPNWAATDIWDDFKLLDFARAVAR